MQKYFEKIILLLFIKNFKKFILEKMISKNNTYKIVIIGDSNYYTKL